MTTEYRRLQDELYEKVEKATGLTAREEFSIGPLRRPVPCGEIGISTSSNEPMQGCLIISSAFPIPQPGQAILYPNEPAPPTEADAIRRNLRVSIEQMKSFLDDMLAHLDRIAEAQGGES